MVRLSSRQKSKPHVVLIEETSTESRQARGAVTGIRGLEGEKELLLIEKFNTVS